MTDSVTILPDRVDYRRAKPTDRETLLLLWHEIFDEPEAGFAPLLNAPEIDILVCEVDGIPGGMGTLIPVVCDGVRGDYLFALGIREAYRNRGLFRRLLKELESTASARGARFCTLIPADSALTRTYARAGYTTEVACFSQTPHGTPITTSSTAFLRAVEADCDTIDTAFPLSGALKAFSGTILPTPLYFASLMGEI